MFTLFSFLDNRLFWGMLFVNKDANMTNEYYVLINCKVLLFPWNNPAGNKMMFGFLDKKKVHRMAAKTSIK